MIITIGGFLQHSVAEKEYFSSKTNPTSEQVNFFLDVVEKSFGVVVMESQVDDESESVELTLYAEDSLYMLILSEPLSDGDLAVRTYRNDDAPDGFVNIFGEPYAAKMTFSEFEVARKAFSEFQETGNVSKNLLN